MQALGSEHTHTRPSMHNSIPCAQLLEAAQRQCTIAASLGPHVGSERAKCEALASRRLRGSVQARSGAHAASRHGHQCGSDEGDGSSSAASPWLAATRLAALRQLALRMPENEQHRAAAQDAECSVQLALRYLLRHHYFISNALDATGGRQRRESAERQPQAGGSANMRLHMELEVQVISHQAGVVVTCRADALLMMMRSIIMHGACHDDEWYM